MTPVRTLKNLATLEARPLWAQLMALCTDPEKGGMALQRMADRAIEHGVRPERVEF